MPSMRAAAFAALVTNLVLLSGFIYLFFSRRELNYAKRVQLFRRSVGIALLGFMTLFLKDLTATLFPVILVLNLLALATSCGLAFLKPRKISRRQDPVWLREYAEKLEAELMERRTIERDLAFIASVAERDPNCVIELDPSGQIGYRNPSTDQTFPDLKAKGVNHPVLAGLQDVVTVLKRDKKATVRRPFRYGERVYEQQIFWFEEARKLCLYMTDVTEWKRLDQMKTELLNTVSHEFRTPLASILATTKMIQCQMLGPVTDDQGKMLTMVHNSADRLNRMITDLLDLSKMEAGRLTLRRKEVDVAEVIENVVLSFTPVAQERKLDLVAEVATRPIICLVDDDKLIQIVTNLLNNALKFTKEGRITVRADATPFEVICSVSDTGIGIPANQMHRVFGKFQQLGASVHGEKGTGLGLSLCKNLVELHRGKISVDSVAGQGTTFTFTLPRVNAQMVFDMSLQQLYEEAATAGRCLSAFVLELDSLPDSEPFPNKVALAIQLEEKVRERLRSDKDMVLREQSRVYFILDSVNKQTAKTVVDELVQKMQPVVESAGAADRIYIRAQFISLPDDGTILEGLQASLAA